MRKLDTESGVELYEGEAIVFKEGEWAVLSYHHAGKFWGLAILHLPCNITGGICNCCKVSAPENMRALIKIVNMDPSNA